MRDLNAPDMVPSIEFAVDSEHSGVRMLGCFTFLFGSVISFLIINTFIPNGGLITIVAAIALAVGLTYTADYFSKKYWPSNRAVQFLGDIIQLTKSNQVQGEIDAGHDVNILFWHFEAKRHPRVPKGWYVVANSLEQDGEFITTYSIVSPSDFESLPLSRLSTRFQRKKKGKKDEKRDLRKAGNMRRIDQAEFYRGEFGAEMSPEDYQSYLEYLAETYTSWMPKDK